MASQHLSNFSLSYIQYVAEILSEEHEFFQTCTTEFVGNTLHNFLQMVFYLNEPMIEICWNFIGSMLASTLILKQNVNCASQV